MRILGMFGSTEILLVLIIGIFFLLLPLIALIDILRSEFNGSNKIIWVLVVLLLPFIGSILYFIIGRNQRVG